MKTTLYLLPAPLGEQASAQDVLPTTVIAQVQQLRTFFVENAKSARAYLKLLAMPVPIAELTFIEIGHEPTPAVIARCIQALKVSDAALISEAGAPAVADPGAGLIRAAHQAGVRVVPLIGPSALLLALTASGLNGQCFAFHGYLPKDAEARASAIRTLEAESRKRKQTQMVIETPYRNDALLSALLSTLSPTTQLCLAVNITQPDEQIITQSIADWRQRMKAQAFEIGKKPTMFLWLG
jgi:16S rRNA (cytidine1402-2'-O)-methyltransferase